MENVQKFPNVYEVGQSKYGKPTIIIRRKPSEIPLSIDWELFTIAGSANMNGPESYVAYEFMLPERFPKGKEFLDRCGWTCLNPNE